MSVGTEAEAEHGRLGKGAELKAWGLVRWSGKLGEGRTEGLGCGKAEWKARERGRTEGLGFGKAEWKARGRGRTEGLGCGRAE
jgi:hypothetical protein